MPDLDLVVIADPRVTGAEGRVLAAVLCIAVRCGYRAALLPLTTRRLRTDLTWHPRLVSAFDAGAGQLDPNAAAGCRVALVWHGCMLDGLVGRRLPLRAGRVVLRIDQPLPITGTGSLSRVAVDLLGVEPEIVFADPALAGNRPRPFGWDDGGALLPPVVEPIEMVPLRHPELRTIGRHGAEGGMSLPIADGVAIHLAEAAARIAVALPDLPPSCHLSGGDLGDPRPYLAGLDGYAVLPAPGRRAWVGAAVAEALAAGVPVLGPLGLPPDVAVEGSRVDGLTRLSADARRALGAAGGAFAVRHLGAEAFAKRLETWLGSAGPRPISLHLRPARDTVPRALFLTPNGVGMGHLTRLLGVARRLGGGLEPVFLSMSQAVGVVERFGWLGEYFPYHLHSGESADDWNRALRLRLAEAIGFYDPRVVVFDGNVPYQGLIDARVAHQDRPFAWIRRGMWRPEAGRETIDRGRHFDLIVEPGEHAACDDPGITAGRRADAAQVAPVTLLAAEEVLGRAAARAELGIDPGMTAIIVQLGSRNNYDYAALDRVIHDEVDGRPEAMLVHVDWLIGEGEPAAMTTRGRRLRTFPVIRYARAFDLAVSGAGYNSFHELLALGVPTIFVPNENPMMDAQEVRALWAERGGFALCVRAGEPYRMSWALRRLLDPARRSAMELRMATLPPADGAAALARMIEELAGSTWLPARAARLARSRPRRSG